jgi:alpha-glucoside transport system permease protein
MIIVVVVFLIPTIGLLVTSLRSREDVIAQPWWSALANPFATEWTVSGYQEILGQGMATAFLNTLVVAVPATIIPILIAAMAAYAFTFIEFPGRDVTFIVVVGLLVIPGQVAFIPLLQLLGTFNLVGTFAAVWLAHTGFGMPLAVFLLRSYMSTLPRAVIESAKIDGASHFQTFVRLILPMSVPALAAFAIFQFLWVWNDLLVALIFLGAGENETVTINLQSLLGTFASRWDLLAPGAFITMTLPLIVFFALQRFFVRGMTAGSVKG